MKPAILLQTDFSLSWGAVASMKGVMRQVDPQLDVVDLCHEIRTYDPWEASLSLAAVEPYWPKGTIFVSVVDPGVGTARRACAALLKDGNIIITPDNGTLTHMKIKPGIQEIREIDETINRFHPDEEVSVFHGRDLFGYCAARLASGIITFAEVGPEYPVDETVMAEEYFLHPSYEDGVWSAVLMTGLRHFGGVELNISNREWEAHRYPFGTMFQVEIYQEGKLVMDETIPYVQTFGDVKEGMPLLYRGSSSYLSLDCNQASFMDRYHVDFGKTWTATIRETV